jgi:hypothetical protein
MAHLGLALERRAGESQAGSLLLLARPAWDENRRLDDVDLKSDEALIFGMKDANETSLTSGLVFVFEQSSCFSPNLKR